MLAQKWFEDFKMGDKFSIPSKTITAAHFFCYAALSGDNHPIHYDDEYAKATVFGRRPAHGLMLTAMTPHGASDFSLYVRESMIALLEESSHYLKPVFIGDTLTIQFEVVELIPKRDKGLLKLKVTMTNQNGDIVMEGNSLVMLKCRGTTQ